MTLSDMQTEAAVEAILHRIDEDAETCKDAIAAAVREQMFGGDSGEDFADEYETDAYGYAVNLHRLSVACDALEEAQTEGGQP